MKFDSEKEKKRLKGYFYFLGFFFLFHEFLHVSNYSFSYTEAIGSFYIMSLFALISAFEFGRKKDMSTRWSRYSRNGEIYFNVRYYSGFYAVIFFAAISLLSFLSSLLNDGLEIDFWFAVAFAGGAFVIALFVGAKRWYVFQEI